MGKGLSGDKNYRRRLLPLLDELRDEPDDDRLLPELDRLPEERPEEPEPTDEERLRDDELETDRVPLLARELLLDDELDLETEDFVFDPAVERLRERLAFWLAVALLLDVLLLDDRVTRLRLELLEAALRFLDVVSVVRARETLRVVLPSLLLTRPVPVVLSRVRVTPRVTAVASPVVLDSRPVLWLVATSPPSRDTVRRPRLERRSEVNDEAVRLTKSRPDDTPLPRRSKVLRLKFRVSLKV